MLTVMQTTWTFQSCRTSTSTNTTVFKMRYLYIWTNHLGRTCYGITSNPDTRKRKYEGHNGFEVNWLKLYAGPSNHIADLEDRIKGEFWDHLFQTTTGKYEWIRETVSTEQVIQWLEWEIENTYNGLIGEASEE